MAVLERKEAKKVIKNFFDAYLHKRDLETALSFVSGEIISLGTGKDEIAVGKEALRRLLGKEIEEIPGAFSYTVRDFYETASHEELYCFFCILTARLEDEGGYVSMETRLSGVCCQEEGEWKILNLHMSTPTEAQEDGEFFPVKYGRRAMEKLGNAANRNLAELLTNMVPGGIMGGYLEPGFPLYIINQEMLDTLEYTYEQLVEETGELMGNLMHPDDREWVERTVFESVEATGEYECRYRMITRTGREIWFYDRGRKVITDDGKPAIVSVMIDISESVEAENRLKEEAHQDPLTGILNRKEAVRRMEYLFEKVADGAVLVLDIDNFKHLNDTRGHQAGDRVLMYLAGLLRQSVRKDDVVARLGGDEFLVYLSGMSGDDCIRKKMEGIRKAFAKAMKEWYPELNLSVSIGAARHSAAEGFDEIYKRADDALYRAKREEKDSAEMA